MTGLWFKDPIYTRMLPQGFFRGPAGAVQLAGAPLLPTAPLGFQQPVAAAGVAESGNADGGSSAGSRSDELFIGKIDTFNEGAGTGVIRPLADSTFLQYRYLDFHRSELHSPAAQRRGARLKGLACVFRMGRARDGRPLAQRVDLLDDSDVAAAGPESSGPQLQGVIKGFSRPLGCGLLASEGLEQGAAWFLKRDMSPELRQSAAVGIQVVFRLSRRGGTAAPHASHLYLPYEDQKRAAPAADAGAATAPSGKRRRLGDALEGSGEAAAVTTAAASSREALASPPSEIDQDWQNQAGGAARGPFGRSAAFDWRRPGRGPAPPGGSSGAPEPEEPPAAVAAAGSSTRGMI